MIRLEVDPATAARIVEALLAAAGDEPARDEPVWLRRYRAIAHDIGDQLDALPPAVGPPE